MGQKSIKFGAYAQICAYGFWLTTNLFLSTIIEIHVRIP